MTLTAVITGGAQGIGRGCVDRLLADGWRVASLDIDAAAVAAQAARHPGDALLALEADAGDEDAVAAAFARIARWAPEGPDLLVNNAGIAGAANGPIEDLSLGEWQRRVDSSLTAAFLCSRAAIPALRRNRGAIVNIASTRAFQSEANSEAYAASKGGLCALTHALAVSLGPEIRVNAIAPGWIETRHLAKDSEGCPPPVHDALERLQHPAGRVGTVQDVVETLLWLIGPGGGFMAGQTVVLDGGMSKRMIYEA